MCLPLLLRNFTSVCLDNKLKIYLHGLMFLFSSGNFYSIFFHLLYPIYFTYSFILEFLILEYWSTYIKYLWFFNIFLRIIICLHFCYSFCHYIQEIIYTSINSSTIFLILRIHSFSQFSYIIKLNQ